jgi:hypothetical protein
MPIIHRDMTRRVLAHMNMSMRCSRLYGIGQLLQSKPYVQTVLSLSSRYHPERVRALPLEILVRVSLVIHMWGEMAGGEVE